MRNGVLFLFLIGVLVSNFCKRMNKAMHFAWLSFHPLSASVPISVETVAPFGGMSMMPDADRELPYEGAKEMLLVDNVDNRDFLAELVTAMYDELPVSRPACRTRPSAVQ